MKRILQVFTAFYVTAALIACGGSYDKGKKEEKKEAAENPEAEIKNQISFKVDGQLVTTSGYNIGRFQKKNKQGIRVTTNMFQEPRAFNIDISGITSGSYAFKSGKDAEKDSAVAYGSYYPDYVKANANNFYFGDGVFVITSLDTQKMVINATFSGTAINAKKEKVVITEGKIINGEIKPVMYKY